MLLWESHLKPLLTPVRFPKTYNLAHNVEHSFQTFNDTDRFRWLTVVYGYVKNFFSDEIIYLSYYC